MPQRGVKKMKKRLSRGLFLYSNMTANNASITTKANRDTSLPNLIKLPIVRAFAKKNRNEAILVVFVNFNVFPILQIKKKPIKKSAISDKQAAN